ncbi:MAG TPA: hypothetical protein VLB80_00500 [Candidatus Babeliales bacterium]|nr:hypothetical protein [Candidatus Babeliales bacterium]
MSSTQKYILYGLFVFIFAITAEKKINSGFNPQSSLYEKIAQENLNAVVELRDIMSSNTINALVSQEKQFYELIEESLAKSLNLPKKIKRSAIFKLLGECDSRSLEDSNVLDELSWKNLEILCGPKTNPSLCLAEKLDRASTEAGKAVLYRKIIQPLSSSDAIRAQQHTIKMLLSHESFFSSINIKLEDLGKTEDVILSFFCEDLFYPLLMQNTFAIIGQEKIPYLKKCVNWCNKNEVILEVRSITRFTLNTMRNLRNIIGTPLLCCYGLSQTIGIDSPQLLKDYSVGLNLGQLSKFAIFGSIFYALRWAYESSITNGLVNISDGLMGLQETYNYHNNFKTGIIFSRCLQTKLIHVATYMNNIKQVVDEASRYTELASLPVIKKLKLTFEQLSDDSDVRHLLELLSTNTFKGTVSFFSYEGRLISAYKLMHELKNKFAPLIAAVGELDAQMSIVRLYKEFENKQITFCFPTCINDQNTPAIAATDFWNPLIDVENVVANTLRLGDMYNHCRNIVVSGPNAGGKTTITVRGLLICIILAQSFGIAPAQSLEFTPFGRIITYLNITDDIAKGNSKFTAGVERALEILDVIRKTTPSEFALTAIDEALDGAAYKESQAAAYALFETIGKCNTAICLTTTHLPLVYELEKTGAFANYKVSVAFDEQGNICYPYKLEPGISNQNIVFNVLNEKGFDHDFVARSAEVLQNMRN